MTRKWHISGREEAYIQAGLVRGSWLSLGHKYSSIPIAYWEAPEAILFVA